MTRSSTCQVDGPGQHRPLDVAPGPAQIVDRLAVIDPGDVLLDDRPGVEFGGDVVRGRADQLDAAPAACAYGSAPTNAGRKLWWMLIASFGNAARNRGHRICM